MTALVADRDTPRRSGDLIVLPVRSFVATTIYAGSLVSFAPNYGSAAPSGTELGEGQSFFNLAGVAEETVHNPQGGTATVRVRRRGVFQFACTPESLNVGDLAETLDDQTVGPYTGAAEQTLVGPVVDVDGSSVWVELDPALSAMVRLTLAAAAAAADDAIAAAIAAIPE